MSDDEDGDKNDDMDEWRLMLEGSSTAASKHEDPKAEIEGVEENIADEDLAENVLGESCEVEAPKIEPLFGEFDISDEEEQDGEVEWEVDGEAEGGEDFTDFQVEEATEEDDMNCRQRGSEFRVALDDMPDGDEAAISSKAPEQQPSTGTLRGGQQKGSMPLVHPKLGKVGGKGNQAKPGANGAKGQSLGGTTQVSNVSTAAIDLEKKAHSLALKTLAGKSEEERNEKIAGLTKTFLVRLRAKTEETKSVDKGKGVSSSNLALGKGGKAAKGLSKGKSGNSKGKSGDSKGKSGDSKGKIAAKGGAKGCKGAKPPGKGTAIQGQNNSASKGKQAWSKNGHADSNASQPPNKKSKLEDTNVSAVDMEGRRYDFKHVVVNFANVGASFSKKCMGKKDGDRLFDWEGVRRCVRFLKSEKQLKVVGVINENFRGPDNGIPQNTMPDDIINMCESVEETPRIIGRNHSSADDEMTIKCAYRRNCRFLDNDNYRDWLQQLRDEKIRNWLNKCQDLLQMRYYFDKGLGSFDVLEGNIPASFLAEGKQVDKKQLWHAQRG